jgi:uncharacterized protein (TIGR03067 family)
MSLRDSLGLTALFGPCLCLGLHAGCAQQPVSEPVPIPRSHPLHGSWEGDGDSGKVSLTIEGNSLYFYARPDFQYDTSFTLVPDTDPPQLRATILDTPRTTDGAGDVVIAIYDFEDGTLRLAAVDRDEGEPASFDDVISQYRLEKVQ